jgi:two-component system chemotaxis sensor kinase CheA
MEDLSASFVNEANELLESLEEALLKLENQPDDQEQINTAFRVMHSLKGTGAMFGFEELSAFTHEMESLYDLIRSGKRKIDKPIIDFTFRSIDLIRLLLEKPDASDTQALKQALLAELKDRFSEDSNGAAPAPPAPKPVHRKTKKTPKAATWHIRFEPHAAILQNGTRPLYLIDELSESGQLRAFLHTEKIPPFEHLLPENAYVWWDLLLVSDKEENFIRDVFIFVEDESHIAIKKIADTDLLSLPGAEKEMKNLLFGEGITTEKINTLIQKLSPSKAGAEQKPKLKQEKTTAEKPLSSPPSQIETAKNSEKKEPFSAAKKADTPTPAPEKESGPMLHESVRVPSSKLDELLDIISEVVTTQARLLHYSKSHEDPELEEITDSYEKLSRQLRDNALNMRLIPIYTILIRFKRLVRDLSDQLHKEVLLKTSGTETELDKSMIEKLYDPLMHIIRNSIDHGIESPDERIRCGKPPQGVVHIDTSYVGANVQIKITDDGRGMDDEQLRVSALQKGLITTDAELSHKDLLQLIFQPGFTTSQKVSKVSGRGVGMDVVKKNVEALRGSIEIETEKGKGTTVKLLLPLTLSIIDGLLVLVGNNRYIIPVNNVKRVYPTSVQELQHTFNKVIVKESKHIPFINLVQAFGEDNSQRNEKEMYLVVIDYGEKEMGFVIHSIIGKYQAVIKPLSHIAQQQEIFSGASILGDGEIALVIDVHKMILKHVNSL